jgi:hypothetical protein
MTETAVNQGLLNFINSVDVDLGRDPDSLNLFEWVVEDYFEDGINRNLEYFTERPDLLHVSNENLLLEIEGMMQYFLEKEEYEKCARLKVIKEGVFKKIKELSNII